MAQYVQAWTLTSAEGKHLYTLYSQDIALRKFGETKGATLESLTIVRHENGDREYLPGTVASAVQAYREGE